MHGETLKFRNVTITEICILRYAPVFYVTAIFNGVDNKGGIIVTLIPCYNLFLWLCRAWHFLCIEKLHP